MSARWSDPQPPTPSRAIGISIGVVVILILALIAVLSVTTDRAGANNYPTTTGATTTQPEVTTIPTTVPEVTTTVPQTTTTAGLTCGLCAGQFSPTTTVPVTSVQGSTHCAPLSQKQVKFDGQLVPAALMRYLRFVP